MENKEKGIKKYLAGIFCLLIVVAIFGGIGSVMGLPNMLNTIMNKNAAIQAGKNVAVGYIGGTVAGIVADKSGLKRIVNKGIKFTRGII